ncbi:unnamed protein product [Cuscuta europaea]|uniref:Mitochondrial adenine nucleotide transporter BTL3 n=1 Tax=Cuscuta europaea TaxID=41803 RepID=A0A9P0YXD9_CUSEU|nr:unnamed protein product [Cuscuta europaea]
MSRFDNAIRLKLYLPCEKHKSPNLDGPTPNLLCGGLFLDLAVPAPPSILKSLSVKCRRRTGFRRGTGTGESFLSVSLSAGDRKRDVVDGSPGECLRHNSDKVGSAVETGSGAPLDQKRMIGSRRHGAVNTTKHLWAGAVAAMISRTFVAPLERLKLEYIVCGEQKDIFDLIKVIATTQGLRGFWKGNFVNILRTAPFKAVNFCAYDTYRKQLTRLSGNEETTNTERFVAGAAAGITAALICLPLDTIRTKLVAPGGEAMGGVIGAFHHVIQTEGFFSLYKGLLPSILSMAPSAAVFYGVYDILKSGYLRSPEGRKRMQSFMQRDQEMSAFERLELGPKRTLLHGAIAGACAEVASYPFEVVRKQLQLQGRAPKLGAFAITSKIVEKGGIPALYAGLFPSLLQVLPSASMSYFIYEFMKVVLKVE